MLKLSFSNPKFVEWTTKDGHHVVKCIYSCNRHETDPNQGSEAYNRKFTVEGIASCSPNDTYSLKLGRILADSRAKSRAYSEALIYISSEEDIEEYIKYEQDKLDFIKRMKFLKVQEGEHLKYVLDRADTMAE